MGFRIMQLQNQIGGKETEIIQGISLEYGPKFLDFGYINFSGSFALVKENLVNITKIQDYDVSDLGDGFKDIFFYAPLEGEKFREEGVLLIIKFASRIEPGKGVKKVAGRYSEEGVFLLEPESKITVTMGSRTEEYGCAKFEDKVYLVRIHND